MSRYSFLNTAFEFLSNQYNSLRHLPIDHMAPLLPLVRGPLLLSLADRTKSSLSGDPVDEVACVGELTSRKAIVAVCELGETAFHVNEKGYVSGETTVKEGL